MYHLFYERLYDGALLFPWILLRYGLFCVIPQRLPHIILYLAFSSAALGIGLSTSGYRSFKRLTLWLFCLALSAGVAASLSVMSVPDDSPGTGGVEAYRSRTFLGIPANRVVRAYGTVADDLRPAGVGERFAMDLEYVSSSDGSRASAAGTLNVFVKGHTPQLYRGREVWVALKIDPEKHYASTTGEVQTGGWRREWQRLRADGLTFVHNHLRSVGPPATGLLSALLLGIRSRESEGLFVLFRRSGAVHLLALSGMHLGFLFLLIAGIAVPLFGKRPGLVLTLLGMVLYLLFVGPRPSLLRAVLMSGLGILWCLLSPQKIDTLRLLVFSAIVQMALVPEDVYSLSFGLSYLALFGILGCSKGIEGRLPFWIPPKIRGLAAAGIAAQAFSAPLLLAAFGELHPGGVIASVVLTPAVLLLMGGSIFYLIWAGLGGLLQGQGYVRMDAGYRAVLRGAASLIERGAEVFSMFPSLRFPGERGKEAAISWILILTLIALLHYGGTILRLYRRKDAAFRKPRFPKGNRPVPKRHGSCSIPPIWAELSDQSECAPKDHRAA